MRDEIVRVLRLSPGAEQGVRGTSIVELMLRIGWVGSVCAKTGAAQNPIMVTVMQRNNLRDRGEGFIRM